MQVLTMNFSKSSPAMALILAYRRTVLPHT